MRGCRCGCVHKSFTVHEIKITRESHSAHLGVTAAERRQWFRQYCEGNLAPTRKIGINLHADEEDQVLCV